MFAFIVWTERVADEMKTLFILISIALVSVMVSTSPIELYHGTPLPQDFPAWRPPPPRPPVKAWPYPVKGHPEEDKPFTELRKGEYMCGKKICKLKPGEIPEGCKGHICQYPI